MDKKPTTRINNVQSFAKPETRRVDDRERSLSPNFSNLKDQILKGRYKVVDRLDVILGEDLYSGEARIFMAEDAETGKSVVIKLYHIGMVPKTDVIEALQGLDHPNILKIVDYGQEGKYFYEVQEFAAGGQVGKYAPYDEKALHTVIRAVNEAIHALHAINIVHRDIKPSNMLYTDKSRKNIVLADYGISSIFEDESVTHRTTRAHKTIGYAAPEVYGGIIDREADYYSLGISLLELVLGINPFNGLNEKEITFRTLAGDMALPENLSPHLKLLIRGLLFKEREKRFGYEEVKKWLEGKAITLPEETLISAKSGNRNHVLLQRSFAFNNDDLKATTIQELITMMRDDYRTAIKHIRRGNIAIWLKQHDMQLEGLMKLGNDIDDLMEQIDDDELLYLKVVYLLEGKPRFLGKYETLKEVAEYIDANRKEFEEIVFKL